MHVLITGATGFIGRHLQDHLTTAKISATPFSKDVREPIDEDFDTDVIVHLAAATGVASVDKDRYAIYATNILGTLNILEYCRQYHARLIFMSTSGVYEPSLSEKLSEESPTRPQSIYTKSKYLAESLCETYSRTYNISCTVFRIFNGYGPGQNNAYLIPYIIENALTNNTIVLKNPKSVRDLIHVDDIIMAVKMVTCNQPAGFNIYNIGSGNGQCVIDIVTLVENILGKPVQCKIEQLSSDQIPYSVADIGKAYRELDWWPKVDIRDGLNRMIEAFNQPTKRE